MIMSPALQTCYLETHGCQMNEYDSEKIMDHLKAHYPVTQTCDPEAADLLILNTCAIREKAEEKVFSALGRWHKFKKKHPQKLIAVGGCVASQEGESIPNGPPLDNIFGPQTLHRLQH